MVLMTQHLPWRQKKKIQDCQTKDGGQGRIRWGRGDGVASSVGYCHDANMSLVQMPAMGFRDDSVPRRTYKHDRGRGCDPSVK